MENKNKLLSREDRIWAGFEQQLTTPPTPGTPTIRYRDYNGVTGTQIIWSDEKKRWEFTGVELGQIPPQENQPTIKTSFDGRIYTWVPEKGRWWCM
jgi:hypothetical protein